MRSGGGENIQNSATNSKLTAPRDHVHSLIGQLDQLQRKLRKQVVVAAGKGEWGVILETTHHRLQGSSDGDQQRDRVVNAFLDFQHAMQRLEALTHSLSCGREPFVRERLPGGELNQL